MGAQLAPTHLRFGLGIGPVDVKEKKRGFRERLEVLIQWILQTYVHIVESNHMCILLSICHANKPRTDTDESFQNRWRPLCPIAQISSLIEY